MQNMFNHLYKSIVSFQITYYDEEKILFPSITFCKYYMYSMKGFLDRIKSDDISPANYSKLFNERTWSRDQLFRTVSQNTVDGKYKMPCNTIGGPLKGAPCTFPFVYPDCLEQFEPTP